MSQTNTPADKSTIACGLLTVAMGAFLALQTSGLVNVGARPDGDAPSWVGVCAGLIFIAGGVAVVLQSLPFAKFVAGGNFSADTPTWVRSVTLALVLTIVGGLAAIGGWVAFGPGPRHFHVVGMFIGGDRVDDAIGRVVFGIGTVLTGLIFAVFAVTGARRLRR